ncbi:MAG: cation transporter [Ardenticatenaceae bacterium]|nr:cation transporter [Ardenticatenaceae bacterium]
MPDRQHLTRFAWLSIGTAVITIALKAAAYLLTGSIGLLSDALESGVNLITAVLALIILTIAARPPDDQHAYGHDKAEYFSGGVEGTLILIAALTIIFSAIKSLFHPQPLQQLGIGIGVSLIAAICNGLTARILLRAGEQHNSITLTAGAHHLLADVWTSGGVVLGVTIVALTGWQPLDPILAILVALHILRSGLRLVRQAINGLMDTALPPTELDQITTILEKYCTQNVQYHALRTRQSGARRFLSVHIQVPGAWSVQKGHSLLEEIERELRQAIAPVTIVTHLEPVEDPVSWHDITLYREE